MEVYEDVEEDHKALKQDEGIKFARRKIVYVAGSFQYSFDEASTVHA